uniref:SOAR domain-containing protein n=1 Tax=Macrostomum lignano TaxID=282301 RepID=A0A1I8F6G2_9PLAT
TPRKLRGFAREELAYATDFERRQRHQSRGSRRVNARTLEPVARLRHYNWTADEVHFECLDGAAGRPPELAVTMRHLGIDASSPAVADGTGSHHHQAQSPALSALLRALTPAHRQAHSIVKDGLLALLLVIILAGSWLVLVQRQFFEDHRLKRSEAKKFEPRKCQLEELYKREICGRAQGHVTVPADQSEPAGLPRQTGAGGAGGQPVCECYWIKLLDCQQPVGFCGAGGAELQTSAAALSYETELRYCQCQPQYSVIGLLRNAFDSAEMVDIVEQDIVRAKEFADKVKLDIQERLQRWSRIEQLIGFSIILPSLSRAEDSTSGLTPTCGAGKLPRNSSVRQLTPALCSPSTPARLRCTN